jgi:NAD(P)-dependent dehydrogenase (short-subunit alcohol dehydrogenase family)
MPNALIVGHDSELGLIAANHLISSGWQVFGTTRRESNVIEGKIFYCDLDCRTSIENALSLVFTELSHLDLVIISVGRLSPISPILDADFDVWSDAVSLNFVNQIFVIQQLLRHLAAHQKTGTKFLTFAGSGTNSAPKNYSAYTLSKIALIKSMELFTAEHSEHFFLSLGTGWMNSAIHKQTLEAGSLAGDGYLETLRRIEENDFGDPKLYCAFLDWYIDVSDPRVSGRNIALQGDDWQAVEFKSNLIETQDSYKLRRGTGMKL